MRFSTLRRAALLAVLFPLGTADAHVTLEQHEAPAGSFSKLQLLVGHGCDGSATTSITVTIPDGVVEVKPMPKPGWTLTTAEADYKAPIQVHGHVATRGVHTITWTGGPLLDAWSDEFAFMAQLPSSPGALLYFPVAQQCESGSRSWAEIPAGDTAAKLKAPAPALTLTEPAR